MKTTAAGLLAIALFVTMAYTFPVVTMAIISAAWIFGMWLIWEGK